MTKNEKEALDADDNSSIAEGVIAEAYARKQNSKSARPQRYGLILNRARGAEKARRKKLADFRAFLDNYQAGDPNAAEDERIKGTIVRIYTARGTSPYDMVMWLLHQRELEDRGLFHLLPEREQGSIEGDSL